jgi:hypothetical protein
MNLGLSNGANSSGHKIPTMITFSGYPDKPRPIFRLDITDFDLFLRSGLKFSNFIFYGNTWPFLKIGPVP